MEEDKEVAPIPMLLWCPECGDRRTDRKGNATQTINATGKRGEA